MQTTEFVDGRGRKYQAIMDGEMRIIIGPPEGLVDELKLPEPFATNLHNVLYERGVLNYAEVRRNPKGLIGALQEALAIDQQKLSEAFYRFGIEEVPHA